MPDLEEPTCPACGEVLANNEMDEDICVNEECEKYQIPRYLEPELKEELDIDEYFDAFKNENEEESIG